MIIVLEGADGVGKTYLAKELCRRLNAKYIHAGYKFKDRQFTYHTAIIHIAMEHVRKCNTPAIIDRWWISESVYSEAYRDGTNYPLMGRYMDRIISKLGGIYVFCLHDGSIEDYCVKYEALKASRYEMYKDTRDVALIYQGIWDGSYASGYDNYANQVSESGGFKSRPDCFRYSIEREGKNIAAFCEKIAGALRLPSLINSDNFIGSLYDSSALMVGDEVCPTRKGRLCWPFHKYANSGLYLTRWLHEHLIAEKDLAWVNIHEKDGRDNIARWLCRHEKGTVVCLGKEASRTFGATFKKREYHEAMHPQAAARFPFNRGIFDRQMVNALI
jgi:hypothetical protein